MMEASQLDYADYINDKPVVYQGQFGEFTITERDRREVIIYRSGLALAALCLSAGTSLIAWRGPTPFTLFSLTLLYGLFSLGLGISLWTIHIYLVSLHRTLQVFWAIGTLSALIIGLGHTQPLFLLVYQTPLTILGIGFTFAALTGIFFKEAFCFNRLETKGLFLLTPTILLGHLTQIISPSINLVLIEVTTFLMMVFVVRKAFQSMPQDIGDKSVFTYLRQQQLSKVSG